MADTWFAAVTLDVPGSTGTETFVSSAFYKCKYKNSFLWLLFWRITKLHHVHEKAVHMAYGLEAKTNQPIILASMLRPKPWPQGQARKKSWSQSQGKIKANTEAGSKASVMKPRSRPTFWPRHQPRPNVCCYCQVRRNFGLKAKNNTRRSKSRPWPLF